MRMIYYLNKKIMTQFINKKEDIVTETVDGIVATSNGKLARLDGYPYIRVVVRDDWDKTKVALVSGGGSGHEPSHAGFVGQGMLTAAVCGDIFASPSVDAVLAGILAVTGAAGCLLIVKNYTGDRLNFGFAAERARAFGLNVEMVIVNDDIALPDSSQARGIAGTLFVHKITGALAEQGCDLKTIANAARKVINGTKSIGMSLDTCTVPGSKKENRILDGMAELGLGIHGESGVEQVKLNQAKQAISAVVEKLSVVINDKPHVVLLNNLGGTSVIEMFVLLHDLLQSKIGKNLNHIIGPATLMTSLDMHGFSISLYPADNKELELLRQATTVISWPCLSSINSVKVKPLPDGLSPITPLPSEHIATRMLLTGCCNRLIESKDDLNLLDSKSGDADTGSTLSCGSQALIDAMNRLPLADHTQLFRAIGLELSKTMGGSSGVLMAIFFTATGDGLSNGFSIVESLKEGLKRVQEVGGAQIGDRSMVDALSPALDAMDISIKEAAKAARAGAQSTSLMLESKVGRAAYINAEQLKGHIDPGAEAVARLFEHLSSQ